MRLAIIDLGTNSVRFDVHQISAKGQVKLLHREKLMVRLGSKVFSSGHLDKAAVKRSLLAFGEFQKIIVDLHVDKVVAFATSALREAEDRDEFVQLVHKKTGIDIKVISGAEEAQLIALGILDGEPAAKGHYALIDIGGGSTEISVCNGHHIRYSESFPLGTARIQQVFLKAQPPSIASITKLKSFIKSVASQKNKVKVPRVIGSGGSVRALAKILRKKHGKNKLERKDLSKLVKVMSVMNPRQLLAIPDMDPNRVDLILAGAIVLEECMKVLGAKEFVPTSLALRDGILKRELGLISKTHSSDLALSLEDFYKKARRFGLNESILRESVLLSEKFFDATRTLHQLPKMWKTYLSIAVIMRDVGESIGLSKFLEHSYYIVKNLDLSRIEKSEKELIAELCLRHRPEAAPEKGLSMPAAKKKLFLRSLALLRLIDALAQNPSPAKILKSQRRLRTGFELSLAKAYATELDVYRVARAKKLFEKVFRLPLSVKFV